MAYIGSNLTCYGFRLLGAIVRKQFPDTQIRFVMCNNMRNLLEVAFTKRGSLSGLSTEDVENIAEDLADSDVVGLASMSEHATQVKQIIASIRKRNPNAFIVWGGVHAIMHPEDAIEHSDAACISEAEVVFPEFLEKFRDGRNYKDVNNFWFHDGSEIIKNGFTPLLNSSGLDELPLPIYGEHELIFEGKKGFVPLTKKHYLSYQGLSYNTVWSRGCPYRCSFCGNNRFLDIDRDFSKLRHTSVDHLIDEIQAAINKFPFISTIAFHDDCFIKLPEEDLRLFAREMRTRIGLPVAIHGVTPADIRRERIEILLKGGLNRVRMGIQSGSDRILKFYKRPNRPGFVKEAVDTLGEFSGKMMPPAYDMIFDNPIETQADVNDTLRLIYDMPRPFTLNIFSLRHIPNTELGRQLASLGMKVDGIDNNYGRVKPTFANLLMYIVALVKIPRPLFEYLLRFTKPYTESTHVVYGPPIVIARILFLAKRAIQHFRWLDFSVAFGGLGYLLWRLGIVKRPRYEVTEI